MLLKILGESQQRHFTTSEKLGSYPGVHYKKIKDGHKQKFKYNFLEFKEKIPGHVNEKKE